VSNNHVRDAALPNSFVGTHRRMSVLSMLLRAAVAAAVALAGLLLPAATVQPAGATAMRLVANEDLGDCLRSDHPTTLDYASGAECPPEDFPYEPVMKITKSGLRATDPYTDGCSNVPDTGATFNFKNACATHDYLADLQRFGVTSVSEASMDNQLLLEMKADCKGRNWVSRRNCESVAYAYRAGVQEGNYSAGDSITSG
jgi:hypothetical protein